MNIYKLTGYSAICFVSSYGLTYLWIVVANRIGAIDRPNQRSAHSSPVPRGGGIGFVVTILFSSLILGWFNRDALPFSWAQITWVYLATLLLTSISLKDDFTPLPAKARLFVHIVVGFVISIAAGFFDDVTLPFISFGITPLVATILAAAWIVTVINITNFMDGIDAIATMQALVSGCAWLLIFHQQGASLVSMLTITCAISALLGFLLWNFHPAKVFMGDVGSAFLGLVLGVVPLLLEAVHLDPPGLEVFAVMTLWPFLADGFFTLTARLLRRENVLTAHKSHLYQRLVAAGWSQLKVVCLYTIWAILTSSAGFVYVYSGDFLRLAALIIVAVSLFVIREVTIRAERMRAPAKTRCL